MWDNKNTILIQRRLPTPYCSPVNREKTLTPEYNTALVEHTATMYHVINWGGMKTMEHVPDKHVSGIRDNPKA